MASPHPRFALTDHLDRLYRADSRELAADTETGDVFRAWQDAARARTRQLLGLEDRAIPSITAQNLLDVQEREGYREEKWAITTSEAVNIPLYLLIPHGAAPRRPLLVFHGHTPEGSVQPILGHFEDERTADRKRALDENYAQRLAQAGYLVCAVEQRAFGERVTRTPYATQSQSCRHQSLFYQMMGRTMVGERCMDGMVALDFLLARSGRPRAKVGVTGHSGGGTTTLWLAALDSRLDVVVCSCYFCGFRESVMDLHHCECNYVPQAARYFDMGDLAALIAPRPLLFIQGQFDEIFPIEAARREFRVTREAYRVLDAERCLAMEIRPAGHAYHVPSALDFFRQWL